ncbi:uncharacterized protein LOC112269718 [Brachypodium distachyon]|uniref:uncharacterized protein LOC112269718 n=1 Tax=Brachypodium distachyon TaxID=15368 RepID=UPI000D0DCF4D|nr:uncharacterized protein LOC112269718 [Brachypodium distachyon]|eukprot:XP_024312404.1 uncharacterized protein LOC112269718 [Brachypodium distachyon]
MAVHSLFGRDEACQVGQRGDEACQVGQRGDEACQVAKPFLDVCKQILSVLDKFGAAMAIVKSPFGGNVTESRNTEEAEAKACVVGLRLLGNVSQAPVILESDNAVVVNVIKSNGDRRGRIWHVYEEVMHLKSFFQDFAVWQE